MCKKVLKWMVVMMLFVTIAYVLTGCIEGVNQAGDKTYAVDPNTMSGVEEGLGVVGAIATVVTPFFQPAAIIAVIAGWGAGLVRKLNPVLSKARTSAEIREKVLKSVVTAIEAAAEIGGGDAVGLIKDTVGANLMKSGVAEDGKNLISALK